MIGRFKQPQTNRKDNEKGMQFGCQQPLLLGERCVTAQKTAARETISFSAFWKFLRLGNLAWEFLGLIFCPGIFFGFDLPLFDHPHHLKSGVTPWGAVNQQNIVSMYILGKVLIFLKFISQKLFNIITFKFSVSTNCAELFQYRVHLFFGCSLLFCCLC